MAKFLIESGTDAFFEGQNLFFYQQTAKPPTALLKFDNVPVWNPKPAQKTLIFARKFRDYFEDLWRRWPDKI